MQNNNKLHDVYNQSDILDISSGFLHLAADSLVPNSINKHFLENAKVLQQVDKKFIPIVAGKTLAVIDQVHSYFYIRNGFSNWTYFSSKPHISKSYTRF